MQKQIILILFLYLCIFAEGSREQDSLALVAIQQANPGNTLTWSVDKAIDNWSGVTVKDNRVVDLLIANANIPTLPDEIGNLDQLTSLQILDCDLKNISPEIGKLSNLVKLFIFNNFNIAAIPKEIGQLSKLKEFTVESGKLKELPIELKNLISIEEIDLHNNRFETFPEALTYLITLKELTLSANDIGTLPEEIGNLVNLTMLDLKKNNLTTLPSTFNHLKKLLILNVGENELTEIFPNINTLTLLEELYISRNPISTLSAEIQIFTHLKYFSIHACNLTSLPKELGQLTNLKSLTLSYNKFADLPIEITNLKPTTLSLSMNYLSELFLSDSLCDWLDTYSTEWKSSQQKLETSHLEIKTHLIHLKKDNPESSINWYILDTITTWDGVTFDPLIEDITELKLSKKNLTYISDSIINLKRLAVLDISRNFITELPEKMGEYKYLRDINLSHNDIAVLPEGIIALKPSKALDVSYNNLKDIYMTDEMITWLDTYDPDWRDTQGLENVISTGGVKESSFGVRHVGNELVFSNAIEPNSHIFIYSLSGRKLFQKKLCGQRKQIPTLPKGIYVVKVTAKDVQLSQKVVVE